MDAFLDKRVVVCVDEWLSQSILCVQSAGLIVSLFQPSLITLKKASITSTHNVDIYRGQRAAKGHLDAHYEAGGNSALFTESTLIRN